MIEGKGIAFAKAEDGDKITYCEIPVVLAVVPEGSNVYWIGWDGKRTKVPVVEESSD